MVNPTLLMVRKIKVPTNLPRQCRANEFTNKPVLAYFNELPRGVPVKVREV